jgi:hypothetical protein
MSKESLKGGLQSLLRRDEAAETQQPENSPSNELRETISDPELKEALSDEVQLKQALRAKRYAGGRPKKGQTHVSAEEGYSRTCIVANAAKMEKIREIAFRETLTIKEVMEAAMDLAIRTYEKKHGEVIPQDHSGDSSNLFND